MILNRDYIMAIFDTNSSSFKKLNEKTQKRLLNLLELSERGIGGEKHNAISRLSKMLKKYNLSIKKMHEKTLKTRVCISFDNEFEERLIRQIAWSLDIHGCVTAPRNTFIFTCSPIQAADLQCRFNVYKEELMREMELTLESFIHANLIFPDKVLNNPDLDKIDPDEERSERMVSRALSMSDLTKDLDHASNTNRNQMQFEY